MKKDTFYITTAIDYTNAPPHIGHAYEKVLADAIARYQRLAGRRVFFLTGVDQHGQKVQQSAQKAGVPPLEFADAMTAKFEALWKKLGLSHDAWARTTDPLHKNAVSVILQGLQDEGRLYKAPHTGFYSVRQEQFLTDKERGADGEFGSEWGEVVELEEENYYFPLQQEAEWLANFIEATPDLIYPGFRRGELLNAVKRIGGDLCISRPVERLGWGIPLPFDSGFVTYVWFDALINYLSFAGYAAEGGMDVPEFERLWPCDAHVIGKDILIPAHGVYWPIMLKGMGFEDNQMPKFLVHGWWNIDGAKMSKSLGNIVDPDVLADEYGPDALRYYLLRDIRTGQDADFSAQRLRERYNSDLANDLGNLLNRSLSMSQRYREGRLKRGNETMLLGNHVPQLMVAYREAMESWRIDEALETLWRWITLANGFVESEAPWKLAKQAESAARLDAVLYELCEMLRILAVLVGPVMPQTSLAMLRQIGLEPASITLDLAAIWGGLPDGHVVGKPEPLFPRLEA